MILNEKIDIKIFPSNKNIYVKKYNCNVGDIISIDIADLSMNSTTKINAKCDICGKEKEIQYRHYNRNIKNKKFFVCSLSCAQSKIKMTKLENHNDENYSGIEKRKQTCKEKYNNETFKNIEKQKKTNLKKYGVKFPIQNKDVQEKRKQTWLEIYHVEHPMKNDDIKMKSIKKSLKTKKEIGYNITDKNKNEYLEYRKYANNFLKRIRTKFLENWNGYDYYDNEYIKDNINLNSNDKNYPTLDHKISVFYGFNNNISIDEINSIENICVTKRSINSSKQQKSFF